MSRSLMWFALGVVLARLGWRSAAARASGAALRLEPGIPEAWTNMSAALISSGRLSEGLEAVRWALLLGPDSPDGWYNLGLALSLM